MSLLQATSGSIEVKLLRVRGLEQRFESQLLPLFVQSHEAHGQASAPALLARSLQGDFDLASIVIIECSSVVARHSWLRLSRGRGPKWQLEYEACKS
jgi:hypothetical protein